MGDELIEAARDVVTAGGWRMMMREGSDGNSVEREEGRCGGGGELPAAVGPTA